MWSSQRSALQKRQALLRCCNLLPRIVSLCEPPLAHLLSYTGGSSIRKDLPPREHHQIQELWSLWLRLQEPPRPQGLPEGPVQGDPTPPGPSYSDPREVGTGGPPAPPNLGSLPTAKGQARESDNAHTRAHADKQLNAKPLSSSGTPWRADICRLVPASLTSS